MLEIKKVMSNGKPCDHPILQTRAYRRLNFLSINQKHEMALVESVHKTLDCILGEGAKHALLYHLELNHSVREVDIPKRPEVFDRALRGIMGSGAVVLETEILKQFYVGMGLEYTERMNWTFADYVNDVKKHIENKEPSDSSTDAVESIYNLPICRRSETIKKNNKQIDTI